MNYLKGLRKHFRAALLLLAAMMATASAGAQVAFGDIPDEVKAEDATITKMGHATMTVEMRVVTDTLTRRTDTLHNVTNIEWNTEKGTAKRRMAERGDVPFGSGFYNGSSNWWLDIYWYSFDYPSINAEGERILLSALACMPDEDCDYINNVIIGCHVTITSNKECPSSYTNSGDAYSDVSLLMNHAGSGLVFHASQSNMTSYNLVIMPDYEGYGTTRSHAHPYLYQELSGRQVVDGARYGIALYKNAPEISGIRHNFRSGWRSMSIGYSQGGAVAMATQRFIEQNDLTDELNFTGSICGDGPYSPLATLLYYVDQYRQGKPLSMPTVLPLILKGMCDSNPYMKNHQVSDYLTPYMLNSGILDWLAEKEKTTDDITSAWDSYFSNNKLTIGNSVQPSVQNYLNALYDANPNYTSVAGVPLPNHRGLIEDFHLALESNDLTKGWIPQHAIFLYHSYDDSVVPEANRESASNAFGNWAIKLHSGGDSQFDHIGSGRLFFLGTAEPAALKQLAKAPIHQTVQDAINMKNSLGNDYIDR